MITRMVSERLKCQWPLIELMQLALATKHLQLAGHHGPIQDDRKLYAWPSLYADMQRFTSLLHAFALNNKAPTLIRTCSCIQTGPTGTAGVTLLNAACWMSLP